MVVPNRTQPVVEKFGCRFQGGLSSGKKLWVNPPPPSLLQGHCLCHRAMFLRETLLDDPSNDQLLWRPLPCYLLACISLEHVYQEELLWIQD